MGRDKAYERAERGLQEGSQRSGVGHGLQEPGVLVEPDWSHGMEKGHRGGESRSARVRVWGSIGHVAPVECRVCTRSGRSKGRGETGTESERTLNVRLRREGVMWHPGSVLGSQGCCSSLTNHAFLTSHPEHILHPKWSAVLDDPSQTVRALLVYSTARQC